MTFSTPMENQKISLNFFTKCCKYFVYITTIITESNPLKIAAARNIFSAAAYF